MICQNCGTLNIDEAMKCSQCQSRLSQKLNDVLRFTSRKSRQSDSLKKEQDIEQFTIEQYESSSDWEKINFLWKQKTVELTKKWKYPLFKNKKIMKLIALVVLFIPAVSMLLVHVLFHISSHTDIELPKLAPIKPSPEVTEFQRDMEVDYIHQQMVLMAKLQGRVEQYYHSQKNLPTLSDVQLQQFIVSQLPAHQPNGMPTMQGKVSIRDGLIESRIQRNFLLDNKNIDDIQIFMIPKVDQAHQFKWQCKVIGVTEPVEGCQQVKIHL